MSPRVKSALEQHKFDETVKLAQLDKKGTVNTHDLVFTNNEGNPVDPDNMIKRGFNLALESAGLRRIRWHDLRHTYATLLIDQNENIKFIQSQLGHASAQITLDRYGHVIPPDNKLVGSKLDESVFGSKGESKESDLIKTIQ